jgi:TrmH family RNA methyltransferase
MARVTAITSRDNPLVARLRRLAAQPDAYRRQQQVWIEGEHLCEAWLARGGVGAQALIGETAWGDPGLQQLARRADAVAVLPDALMRGLSPLDTPSPLAFAVPWPGAQAARPGVPTVVFDRLQDAGNVGTILRTAAAFGFTQAVALKGTAALWSPKVLRAGMGAHFRLELVEGADTAALDALDLPLLATSPHAEVALHLADLPWPCAWVLGHEGQGVAAEVVERCAMTLRIAQPGGEESLNVAVAAAICLYESSRRRGTG